MGDRDVHSLDHLSPPPKSFQVSNGFSQIWPHSPHSILTDSLSPLRLPKLVDPQDGHLFLEREPWSTEGGEPRPILR